jgi:hypothetical protein
LQEGFRDDPYLARLAQHPNVILSSHIAFYTDQVAILCQEFMLDSCASSTYVWPVDELFFENIGVKEVSHFAILGTKTRQICFHEKET